jgi:tetratricopeptide (TPR) repeat protein
MARWAPCPFAGEYRHDAASITRDWPRLHAGDAEPPPSEPAVLQAWVLFHNGHFEQACETGLEIGGAGLTVANKATCIYANYLEKQQARRLDLLLQAAQRAELQAAADPQNPNAWYWQAYALGRYSQGISVAKALAQGLGSKVKGALETAIKLQPKHADAHIALGAFHAEVIDKVGSLLGRTQGASKDTGLTMYKQALKLNPTSAIAMIEYANGLVMLEGDKKMKEAEKLYADAAACDPKDAMERLDVEAAKAELED